MPIATPQGTLDFKSVDTITFVGASSNTVIDTTTGSLGVGVDGNGPTSNLHVVGNTRLEGDINMLHTANTASIKLNSNVVTEFPRSKKLIKYPRVAMTSDNQPTGYVASASSYYTTSPNYAPWKAFDNIKDSNSWISENLSYNADGTATGASQVDTFETIPGSWLGIELPNKIKLEYVIIKNRDSPTIRNVTDGIIWASNDGTTWFRIKDFSGLNTNRNAKNAIQVHQTIAYNEYRLQFTKIYPYGGSGGSASIGELELFGVPEYDPEADGTDVTIKSVPNVPNTDLLDIYIDGQDYSTMPSGAGSVLDKSTNNRHGTPSNVTFNSTWKAFEIESASTSNITIPFNSTGGDYIHTIALWFLMDTTSGGNRCIFTIRGSESPGRQIALIVNQDSTSVGFKYDFYSGDVRYHDPSVVANKWMHVALTYSGGDNSVTSKEIYLNGVRLGVTASNSTALNLTGTENLLIGGNLNSSNASFEGMVANFRMFNRVLSKDEIYQLYAYQKEDFGHGDLSMTLKAGRLGIGTSEPRATLDVRGQIMREYNPGEIIEELTTVCNGRPVTVLSGTYTPTNVTASQTSSATHTEINGSNITYNKPAGAKRIYYKFACQWDDAGHGAITNFKIRVYHNGAWRDINPSRYTHAAQYLNDGNHHGQAWVINEYIFECDAETESQHDGRFLSSKTSYTFDVTWRQHGTTSYGSRLHINEWWDGSGTDIVHPPQVTIRAIA